MTLSMEPAQAYDACVEALRGYVEGAGFEQVVLGLSGGIDSALVCAMCVDAFGAGRVHAVLMPGPYSSAASVDDAAAQARTLGVEARTLAITGPFDAFAQLLEPACGARAWRGAAGQNTQARCRMTVLMALSNACGWMLVNTGNKSEAAMGYSTLYGDTAGAFAPLGGLYKTDVYACARVRNDRARAAGLPQPIPQAVLEKAPSAELAPGQRDEDALGMPYDQLDPLLVAHYEHGLSAAQIAAAPGQARSEAELAALFARVDGFAYKRAMEPPYPQAPFYAR